jgi:hypothetical protein
MWTQAMTTPRSDRQPYLPMPCGAVTGWLGLAEWLPSAIAIRAASRKFYRVARSKVEKGVQAMAPGNRTPFTGFTTFFRAVGKNCRHTWDEQCAIVHKLKSFWTTNVSSREPVYLAHRKVDGEGLRRQSCFGRETSAYRNLTWKIEMRKQQTKPSTLSLNGSTDHSGTRGEDWNASLMVTNGVVLFEKLNVDNGFWERVADQYFEILPHLVKNCTYAPVDVLGDKFWNGLTAYEQRMAVVCLKHLARQSRGTFSHRPDKEEGVVIST